MFSYFFFGPDKVGSTKKNKDKIMEKKKKRALRNLKDRNIGFALLLTYFVLPSVSTTLFSMFNCDLLHSETCNYNNCPYKGLDGWPLSDIYPEAEGDICASEVELSLIHISEPTRR